MKKNQSNKLRMFKVVLAVCSNATDVTAQIPAFVNAIGNLQTITAEIERLQALQSTDNKGVTADNRVLNDQLSDVALAIAGALYAWAAENGNLAIREKVNFVASDFIRFSQTQRIAVCTTILGEARNNTEALANNGITAEKINELETLLNNYKTVYTKPREMVVSKTAVTEALETQFRLAGDILKNQADRLARQFKTTNAGFYQEYRKARVIEDRGAHHTSETTTPEPASIPETE